MKPIKLFITGIILYASGACSTDVDFGEQYKKQIYIVNANERMVSVVHPLAEGSDGYVTFYCAGSERTRRDVVIHYKIDKEALDAFNLTEYGDNTSKYLYCVPDDKVTFSEETVTIKAGTDYAALKFSINTLDLDPAANNTIPISVAEVSDYEISPKLKTLFYRLKLETKYSGLYDSRLAVHSFGLLESTKFVQKTTVATAKSEFMVPVLNKKDIPEGSINYYVVTLDEETNLVTLSSPDPNFVPQTVINVRPDASTPAVPTPVNYYDPEKKEFVIGYSYPDVGGTKFIIETMLHID